MKVCSKCGETKPEESFYKVGGNQPGLRADCKSCVAKRTTQRNRELGWCYDRVPCDCGRLKMRTSECCVHCSRQQKTPNSRHLNSAGYVVRNGALEHRSVMEAHIGRTLLQHETVHHKNGNRADNRLENLELWSKSQPYGQRVEDKVVWALEILQVYGPEYLK